MRILQRKRGDSNPRYSYPYVSLANWWFQPLTHTSKAHATSILANCGANIEDSFELIKVFKEYFVSLYDKFYFLE